MLIFSESLDSNSKGSFEENTQFLRNTVLPVCGRHCELFGIEDIQVELPDDNYEMQAPKLLSTHLSATGFSWCAHSDGLRIFKAKWFFCVRMAKTVSSVS